MIFIKTLTGKTLIIDKSFNEKDTILDLKKYIFLKYPKLNVDKQILILSGNLLEDKFLISEQHFERFNCAQLIIKK